MTARVTRPFDVYQIVTEARIITLAELQGGLTELQPTDALFKSLERGLERRKDEGTGEYAAYWPDGVSGYVIDDGNREICPEQLVTAYKRGYSRIITARRKAMQRRSMARQARSSRK